MKNTQLINDVDRSIAIMHHVGTWMVDSGMKPNKYWLPENMNREFLLQESEPDEYRLIVIDGKPAGSMILQDNERNQSWKAVDGDHPQKALYVHWLCVHRDFAGQGVPQMLIDAAEKEAKERGFSRLRLDTNAEEKKLCEMYESLGFTKVGSEQEGEHTTAFYERVVK